jgi:GT2 family glycosyltransferase
VISAVLPSLDRTAGCLRAIDSLRATTAGHDIEIVVVLDAPDVASQAALAGRADVQALVVGAEYRGWPGRKYNAGYRRCRPESDLLLTVADDVEFLPGWLEPALALSESNAVVGLYDGQPRAVGILSLIQRTWIENEQDGYLCYPWYRVWFGEVERALRADQVWQYALSKRSRIEHYHPGIGKGPDDAIYALASNWHVQDEETFRRRRAAGWPADEPALEGPC